MWGKLVVPPIAGSNFSYNLTCDVGQDGWVGELPKHLYSGGSAVVADQGVGC